MNIRANANSLFLCSFAKNVDNGNAIVFMYAAFVLNDHDNFNKNHYLFYKSNSDT